MRNLIKTGLRRLAGLPEHARPTGSRRATVIAVAAQKGGVGKTTTSVNLASGLARHQGKRVLLIDLDPQSHVATALESQVHPGGSPLSRVLIAEEGDPEVMDCATRTEIPNLEITPLDRGLQSAEDLLTTRIGKEFILRDALKITRTHYDFIVIDCPPNLGNLTLNGLVAADQVLVPCDPSPLALNGVNALVRTITTIAARLNPGIDVLGVLLTRVDGRNRQLNDAVVTEIEQTYGDALLPVRIGTSTSLAKAQLAGQDIFQYDPSCRGAQQYKELAEHVAELCATTGWRPTVGTAK